MSRATSQPTVEGSPDKQSQALLNSSEAGLPAVGMGSGIFKSKMSAVNTLADVKTQIEAIMEKFKTESEALSSVEKTRKEELEQFKIDIGEGYRKIRQMSNNQSRPLIHNEFLYKSMVRMTSDYFRGLHPLSRAPIERVEQFMVEAPTNVQELKFYVRAIEVLTQVQKFDAIFVNDRVQFKMEIARIYDWFNTVYKKVSAARHQKKSMFEDDKVQSVHSVRSKEQVRASLLDSERRLYDHQN